MTQPDIAKISFRSVVALMAGCLMAANLWAAEPVNPKQETPHELIEEVTEVLFDVVQEYNGGSENAERYYDEIQGILEPVVDFEFIAKAVMGSHRSEASDEQVDTFVQVFKRGLVTTYAKGIANYVDSEISIRPPSEDIEGKRRVSVDQEVKHEGSTYRLSYTMAKNRSGEWKLINLVLDGVNLGRSFRSQFGQAAKKYDGDLDKVIDNWLDEM
ncbi:ABC transporter substrate-binding protein [Marinimicrobium sp. C6131]|uniref:MlaC/ttg2D family ABC transporter substrate-binding protein n=1 Tax=Marinimicrobium sp. C6131 TaxID=3022676 RepID=UPI00223E2680|nr:ABC transporter substrate-binding protein [Marinimicrobium sp. C6131]UZJ44824.1 ABC transporter substrate-binding protein [Marinimicrobium sp. C6131]